MTDWYELAKRWTPKCPACRQRLDCRMGTEECINEDCEKSPYYKGQTSDGNNNDTTSQETGRGSSGTP